MIIQDIKRINSSSFEFSNITLKLEEGTFENDFLHTSFVLLVLLNNTEIGYIEGFSETNHIHIDIFDLLKKYRRRGYGSIVIEILKAICKLFGLSYINAECRNDLKKFFKSLGVDFTHRNLEDDSYINNRFYIGL